MAKDLKKGTMLLVSERANPSDTNLRTNVQFSFGSGSRGIREKVVPLSADWYEEVVGTMVESSFPQPPSGLYFFV